jgi:hypothetical protein
VVSAIFVYRVTLCAGEIAGCGSCHLTGVNCSKAVVSSATICQKSPNTGEIAVFESCHLSGPMCNKAVVSSTLVHHERPSPSVVSVLGFCHLSGLKNRVRWYHQLWYTTKDLVPVRWESLDAAISSVDTIVCGGIISYRILQWSWCQ